MPRSATAPLRRLRLHRYRAFVQDVGESGYSGFCDVTAATPFDAVCQASNASSPNKHAAGTWAGKNLIALAHTRKDLWPHPKTGAVSRKALELGRCREP